MKALCLVLAAGVLASAALPATATPTRLAPDEADAKGVRDFDFFIGEWRVHHRRLKERLAGSHDWVEFDGTTSAHKIMGGWGNVDDNVLEVPGGGYRAVTLRAFDAKTGQWAIWWLDGRNPAANLDPSVKGRFDKGVGIFYADDTFNGKPIRVRFTWTHATPGACRWEQAFSADGGKTWETNWIMEFRKMSRMEKVQ